MHEVASHELTVAMQQDMMDRAKLKGEVHEGGLKEEELHVGTEVEGMMAGSYDAAVEFFSLSWES